MEQYARSSDHTTENAGNNEQMDPTQDTNRKRTLEIDETQTSRKKQFTIIDVPTSPSSKTDFVPNTGQTLFPLNLLEKAPPSSDNQNETNSQTSTNSELKKEQAETTTDDQQNQIRHTAKCIVGLEQECIEIEVEQFVKKCPFFESLFVGAGKSMKEGTSEVVKFPTISPLSFKMMREFIETGTIEKECMASSSPSEKQTNESSSTSSSTTATTTTTTTSDTTSDNTPTNLLKTDSSIVVDLYLLANQYTFQSLERHCTEILTKYHTNETSLPDLYDLAKTVCDEQFIEEIRRYLLHEPNGHITAANSDPRLIFEIYDDPQNIHLRRYFALCDQVPKLLDFLEKDQEFLKKLREKKGPKFFKAFINATPLSPAIALRLCCAWRKMGVINQPTLVAIASTLSFHAIEPSVLKHIDRDNVVPFDISGLYSDVNMKRYSEDACVILGDEQSFCSSKSKIRTVLMAWLWHVLSECEGKISQRYLVWFRAVFLFDRFLERKTSYVFGKKKTHLRYLQLLGMISLKIAVKSLASGKISKLVCRYYTDDAYTVEDVNEIYREVKHTKESVGINPGDNVVESLRKVAELPTWGTTRESRDEARRISELTVSLLAFAMLDWKMVGRPISILGQAASIAARLIWAKLSTSPETKHQNAESIAFLDCPVPTTCATEHHDDSRSASSPIFPQFTPT